MLPPIYKIELFPPGSDKPLYTTHREFPNEQEALDWAHGLTVVGRGLTGVGWYKATLVEPDATK